MRRWRSPKGLRDGTMELGSGPAGAGMALAAAPASALLHCRFCRGTNLK